ncbi:hypothetical protein GQ44DRAFT_772882 [Phaeosphaeriaceae sp. PMI808]|nr:hypothetical protein GQ44DRAFT_772882 [Phaeosphaeriaceae sp. PMI808]
MTRTVAKTSRLKNEDSVLIPDNDWVDIDDLALSDVTRSEGCEIEDGHATQNDDETDIGERVPEGRLRLSRSGVVQRPRRSRQKTAFHSGILKWGTSRYQERQVKEAEDLVEEVQKQWIIVQGGGNFRTSSAKEIFDEDMTKEMQTAAGNVVKELGKTVGSATEFDELRKFRDLMDDLCKQITVYPVPNSFSPHDMDKKDFI